jgi:hypothetical protein
MTHDSEHRSSLFCPLTETEHGWQTCCKRRSPRTLLKLRAGSAIANYRIDQFIDTPVKYTVDDEHITVTDYDQLHVSSGVFVAVFHVAFAFAASETCAKMFASPLVLNFGDEDRLDLIAADAPGNVARFDVTGRGVKDPIGWIPPSAGLLALDINGDGAIADGTELFGEYTRPRAATEDYLPGLKTFANGFEALAQYDDNRDGVIDAKDRVFDKLVVWRNRGRDGQSRRRELFALKDLGIRQIDLNYRAEEHPRGVRLNGNKIHYVATYKTKFGVSRSVYDVWFRVRSGLALQTPRQGVQP